MLASLRPRAGAVVRRTKSALRAVWGVSRSPGALVRSAAGLPIPIFLTANGIPSARPDRGPIPHRVMVCSLPKAGTYLVGEVVRRLGAVATSFHVTPETVMDTRFATREEARNEYTRLCHPIPLERSLPLVCPGQFAVSHLECSPRTRDCLVGFKVVFVYRELRDAFVSWLRFHQDTGREQQWNWIWSAHPDPRERLVVFMREAGHVFFDLCRAMRPWITEPTAFPVRFETLHGDEGAIVQEKLCRELAGFLDHANPVQAPSAVLPGLTTTQTLTSSGSRTKRDEFWSATAEELFQSAGGGELNAAFGYGARSLLK